MQHVLIVGKAFSGIKQYLIDNNFEYTVLQDELATKFPDKRFKHRIVCSFGSKESILQAVDSLDKTVDAVIAVYESYILPTSWITSHLGLPGLSEQAATACTDKEKMRGLFATAAEPISPQFAVASSKEQLSDFASRHTFPLILKPANLSKSLLVTKCHDLDELLTNYERTMQIIDKVYKKYAPHRVPKLIVEEFLEGSIHSVDAFVDINGEPHVLENVVDYQTGYDIGFDDNFHYSRLLPSKLSSESQSALRHVAVLGCKALGIKSAPAHIEIIMTKNGPRIVEIGARNGGYRERMHALANDIDIQGNAIALSLNQPLNIVARRNDHCAVLELFPKIPGKFHGIENEEKLRSLSSLYYLSVKAKPDQFVGKAGDGYKACCIIILANEDTDIFDTELAYINEHVFVNTQA